MIFLWVFDNRWFELEKQQTILNVKIYKKKILKETFFFFHTIKWNYSYRIWRTI